MVSKWKHNYKIIYSANIKVTKLYTNSYKVMYLYIKNKEINRPIIFPSRESQLKVKGCYS